MEIELIHIYSEEICAMIKQVYLTNGRMQFVFANHW